MDEDETLALLFRRDDDGKAREMEANIMTRTNDDTIAHLLIRSKVVSPLKVTICAHSLLSLVGIHSLAFRLKIL